MITSLDAKYTDPLRRFWITDNLPHYDAYNKKLSVKCNKNVTVCRDGNFVEAEIGKNNKAIYLGHFLNIWGHCITDNLSRLWYLKTDECKYLQKNGYKLVCTIYKSQFLLPNFIELLDLCDIDAHQIQIINVDETFTELIIPDRAFDEKHLYHYLFTTIIDTIVSKIEYNDKLPKKLYFSRVKLHTKRDFGEQYVEDVFRKLGYEIVYPEKHSLIEQLSMLKSCDSFAATEGSVSHNIMFCRNGIESIVIRKTVSLNGYQFSANAMRQCCCVYIDAHLSLFFVFRDFGPFFIYVNDNLVRFANDRGVRIRKKFPRLTFIHYMLKCIWYCVRYRQKLKPIIRDFDFYKQRLK